MGLIVYNSLTRKKEEFKPLHDKEVKMFVCGQTVYDDAHLGHAKTYVQFDIIARWLRKIGFNVFYVQNITDIEDKIINRAKESGVDPLELSRKFAERYIEDLDALVVKKNVNMFPKTTDYIPQMIEQIKTLVKKDMLTLSTEMYTTTFPNSKIIRNYLGCPLKNSRSTESNPTKGRETPLIFPCGKARNQANWLGTLHGGRADQDGT